MSDAGVPPDSPRGRVALAFELYEFAERMRAQRFRRQHPGLGDDELEARMEAWRSERPGAEQGDAPGRPVAWPRRT